MLLQMEFSKRVLISGERLHDGKGSDNSLRQLVERDAAVVPGDRIVHRFPETFDLIRPGLVCGLKHHSEFLVLAQPSFDRLAFVDDVVVEDEGDLAGSPVSPA